jgi:hypothetical protein
MESYGSVRRRLDSFDCITIWVIYDPVELDLPLKLSRKASSASGAPFTPS